MVSLHPRLVNYFHCDSSVLKENSTSKMGSASISVIAISIHSMEQDHNRLRNHHGNSSTNLRCKRGLSLVTLL